MLTTLTIHTPPSASNAKPSGQVPAPYCANTSRRPSEPSCRIGKRLVQRAIVSFTYSHLPVGSTIASLVKPTPWATMRAPRASIITM